MARNRTEVQALKTYKAAVVTLPGRAIPQPTEQGLNDLVEKNIEIYENYIAKAGKQKVDILGFPEATLNYFGMTTLLENFNRITNRK